MRACVGPISPGDASLPPRIPCAEAQLPPSTPTSASADAYLTAPDRDVTQQLNSILDLFEERLQQTLHAWSSQLQRDLGPSLTGKAMGHSLSDPGVVLRGLPGSQSPPVSQWARQHNQIKSNRGPKLLEVHPGPELPEGDAASRDVSEYEEPASPASATGNERETDMPPQHGRRHERSVTLTYSNEEIRRREAAHDLARSQDRGGSMASMQLRSCAETLVTSTKFEAVITTLIVLNSFFMGLQVEINAQQPQQGVRLQFFIVDTLFALIFSIELLLRLVAFKSKFFSRAVLHWSLLDVVLVITALLEVCLQSFLISNMVDTSGMHEVGSLRLIRILRFARMLRALRMTRLIRFVASLRTLVSSVVATLQSLMWALLLMVMLIYIMAIVLTQSATDYLHDEGADEVLESSWGSLPQSMLTLFGAISGGVSWQDVAEPLGRISLSLVILFVFYIFFTVFAVLNVITGVFCQSAVETVGQDPDLTAQAVMHKKKLQVERLRGLFHEVDKDGSGTISIRELERLLAHEHNRAYLAAMGVEANDAWSIFKLLDTDRNHTIDIEEFVSGLLRIQGSAKSMDMQTVIDTQKWIVGRMSVLTSEGSRCSWQDLDG